MAEPNKGWFDIVKSSYVWKSMFRHEYQDTYRNRVLQVSSNVFLHLHPTKIRRHALRLRFTWCMGGITFLLFLILVVTGVILMFYYRPTGEYAYHDMKYLQFDVPFGMIMRNMHRWARARDGHRGVAAHVPRLHDRLATSRRASSTGSSA